MRFIATSLLVALAAADSPPCHTLLNPALETICSTTVVSEGRFAIRDYAVGLNVTLVSSSAPPYNQWAEDSLVATEELLLYFEGQNRGFKPVARTVPLIYRPSVNTFGQATLMASMAIPTSVFPVPAAAPAPDAGYDALEAFPAQRFAAVSFETAAPATDLQYSFACGEVTQWLSSKGIAPATTGAWAQSWVTYSGRDAALHVQECWLSVPAA